jgi:hypothetical protein
MVSARERFQNLPYPATSPRRHNAGERLGIEVVS